VGITFYGIVNGYDSQDSHTHWLLFLAALPHYYRLFKNQPESNFTIFHNWLVPLSVLIMLGTFTKFQEELMLIAYVSLLGLYYLIGDLAYFKQQKLRNNSFLMIGALGTIGILLGLSFDEFWNEIRSENFFFNEVIASPELWLSILLSALAGGLIVRKWMSATADSIKLTELVFALFILIFIVGVFSPIAVVLINLLVFAMGVLTIRIGVNKNHLGIVNYGLLIVTALITCRFFDSDLTFVVRGLLFVSVGIGFFAVNYMMLKKNRSNE